MQKILEYQKIDSELFKLEREINRSEHRQNVQKMADFIKDAQTKILNLDKQSKDLANEIEKLKQVEKKGIDIVEKYSKQENNEATEEALAELKSRIVQTMSQLKQLENRLLSSNQKAKSLLQEFEVTKKDMNIAKSRHQESKEKLDDLKANKAPEINELKNQLSALEKELSPAFVAKYKALKQDGIFPVVVPLIDKRCGGCRMELPANELENLNSKGKLECPSCRRIIYIQNK